MTETNAAGEPVQVVSLEEVSDDRSVLFDGEPRTVRLSLPEGERVPEHDHPGRTVLFQVLSGRIDLDVGDETRSLAAGDLARFDGEQPVSPAARSDAEALIVLAPTG